jgi:thiamine pyrophosphate-dependent acetolactate synthase large subunit-like protein
MTEAKIDRRELLPQLFENPDDYLFVSGLAGAAKDTSALTDDGDNLYTMAGTMGAAVPMGLGVALNASDRKVVVVTGDGELLMGIGSLVTVASMAPANLSIVCIDNAQHGETGGQPGHTGKATDLETIAKGAGFSSTMTITCSDQIKDGVGFLATATGPRFLNVRVTDGMPSTYKRNMDPAACRHRFRNAYLSDG